MKRWHVKSSGKVERVIIVIFGMSLAAAGIALTLLILGWERASIGKIFIIGSIVWIPALVVALKRVIASSIPVELSLDSDLRLCTIRYSKIILENPYDTLAYSVSENKSNSCVLTFYKTYIGTRGQTVYNETAQIVGLKWTRSWRLDAILEIVEQLSMDQIEETSEGSKGMPLWELLISR